MTINFTAFYLPISNVQQTLLILLVIFASLFTNTSTAYEKIVVGVIIAIVIKLLLIKPNNIKSVSNKVSIADKLEAAKNNAKEELTAAIKNDSTNNDSISDDNQEDYDDFLDNGKVVWTGKKTISFQYKDFNKQNSKRIIDVQQITVLDGYWYFRGLCHLRNEIRTFKADRIRKNEVIDTITGEITTFRKTFNLPDK